MSQAFDQIAAESGNRILANGFFQTHNIAVVGSDLPDQAAAYEDSLNAALSQYGAVVAVGYPEADTSAGNVPGPYYDFFLPIEVWFNPFTPPDVEIEDIATEVVASMQHFKAANANGVFVFEQKPMVPKDVDEFLVMTPRFKAKVGSDLTITKAATPSFLSGALSTTTPGAAIFYRTDGKVPSPTFGTLYSAPLSLTAGTHLTARAFLSGFIDSDCLRVTI